MGYRRMSAGRWRYALASVVGTSHEHFGRGCQDASRCQILEAADDEPVLVAVAADGASASRSEIGAQLLCSRMLDGLLALFGAGGRPADLTRSAAERWLTEFREDVAHRAEAEGLRARDFACTALAAIIGTDCAAFVQIGDGAIVVSNRSEPDDYTWVFWPQRGEYENTTQFATDAAAPEALDFAVVTRSIDEVAVFTDGLQRLALHAASRTAHAPFFRPIFAHVRSAPEGWSEELSLALATFLRSPRVNERTDDDKTLLLATRRHDEEARPTTGDDDDDTSRNYPLTVGTLPCYPIPRR
jgi:hypothetical protein